MKKILILSILLVLSWGLWAQTITLNSLSIQKDGGGNSVVNGDLVRIRAEFFLDNSDQIDPLTGLGISRGSSRQDQVLIVWYENNDGTGSLTTRWVDVDGNISSYADGNNIETVFTFTAPVPPDGYNSFKVNGTIYGFDMVSTYFDDANQYSTSVGGYHAYLQTSSDNETEAPTITAPAEGSTINQNFNLNFNLPEAAQTGSVQVTFFNTGGVSDSFTREFLYADETAGGKTLSIDGFDISATNGLSVINGSSNTLSYGSEYQIKVEYQDTVGNPVASTTVSNLLFENEDTETEAPILTAPTASSTVNRNFDLSFQLPEAATAGTVEISFTRSAGSADANNHLFYYVGDLDGEGNVPAGSKSLSLDGLNITDHANLDIDAASSGALVYGAVYSVRVAYQDIYENPIAYDQNLSVAFENEDQVTEEPEMIAPISNSVINNLFDLSFELPEAAYDGSVKISFERTGGMADSDSHIFIFSQETATTHTLADINPNNISSHNNLTLVSGSTDNLMNGTYYRVRIEYQDINQNPIATDYNSNIFYGSDYIILNGGDYNVGASFTPGSVDNAFFQLGFYKTAAGTAEITSVEFDLTGTYILSDISNAKLWLSTSSSFDGSATLEKTITTFSDPLTFSDLSINANQTMRYLYLTADIAADANTENSIGAGIINNSDIVASRPVYGAPINGGDHALPVTLSSFQAAQDNQSIVLNWVTASESNNSHWNVYRSPSANFGQAQKLNATGIEAAGFSTQPVFYEFVDLEYLAFGNEYWYWIEAVALNGLSEVMEPIHLAFENPSQDDFTPEIPQDFGLFQNSPNPFNPDTKISFALEENAAADLVIYNVKGQKIQTLYQGQVVADRVYNLWWDGKDVSGKPVSSGVYFYILKTSIGNYRQKMLLTK
jgi:hypothetical protein